MFVYELSGCGFESSCSHLNYHNGFDINSIHKDTNNKYDLNGFDRNGRHKDTNNKYDLNGFDRNGVHEYTKNGYDIIGFDRNSIHKDTKNEYDPNGYDINGINKYTNTFLNRKNLVRDDIYNNISWLKNKTEFLELYDEIIKKRRIYWNC